MAWRKGCVIGQLLLAQAPSQAPLAQVVAHGHPRVGANGAALECCVSDAMAVIVSRFAPPDHPKCLRSRDLPGHRRHDRCCGTWGSYHLVHRSLLCSRFVLLPCAACCGWMPPLAWVCAWSHGLGRYAHRSVDGYPTAYVLQLAALIVLAAASWRPGWHRARSCHPRVCAFWRLATLSGWAPVPGSSGVLAWP